MKLSGISAKIIYRHTTQTPYGRRMVRKDLRLSDASGEHLDILKSRGLILRKRLA